MGDLRRCVLAIGLLLAFSSPAMANPGALLWSEASVPGRASKLAIGEGALVVLAHDLSAYAYSVRVYDPVTGELRRSFVRPGGAGDVVIRAGLVIVSEVSPPAPGNGESHVDLVALRLRSGRERWRVPLGSSATLAGSGPRILAATDAGVLTAHDPRTGRILWRDDEGSIGGLAARDDRIAVTGTRVSGTLPHLVVRVLEEKTGVELWRDEDDFGSPRGAKGQAVAWTGKRLLVGGSITRDDPTDYSYYDDAFVRAYDADSGARLWLNEQSLARDQTVAGLATHRGRIFASIRVQGTAWHAAAYDARSGDPLWKTNPLLLDGSLAGPLSAGGTILFATDPYDGPAEFLATALRTSDGATAWHADAAQPSPWSSASAIAADPQRFYVVGSVVDPTSQQFLAV
jgi:outer membrane protein assembly factor BamB